VSEDVGGVVADGEEAFVIGIVAEEEFGDAVDGHDATDGGYGGGAEEAMVAAGVGGRAAVVVYCDFHVGRGQKE